MEQSGPTGIKALFTHQGKSFFLFLLTWVALITYIRLPRAGDEAPIAAIAQDTANKTVEQLSNVPPASLHLLVPATEKNANICKFMVSAAITGYPSPVLINWERDYKDAESTEGEWHLAKIRGVHEYLQDMHSRSQDDDLVLVVDGNDVWMQLRAQNLIERFFDVNLAATESTGFRQEILFGSQESCSPWTEDDPSCKAQALIPVHKDEGGHGVAFQSRFLGSGIAMGTARAMLKFFRQALERLPTDSNVGSDRNIFSQIFADQQTWRDSLGCESTFRAADLDCASEHVQEVRAKAAEEEDGTFEFGIGIDVAGQISLDANAARHSAAWLRWDDEVSLREAEQKLNLSRNPGIVRIGSSMDFALSPPPFWTYNWESRLDTFRWVPWSNVSLFTNIEQGIAPAVIRHSRDHPEGQKTWWNATWWSAYTRTMFDLSVYEPIAPLARNVRINATSQRDYWPNERGKAGAKSGSEWLHFDDICNDTHDDVFRDGKGPYIIPEHH